MDPHMPPSRSPGGLPEYRPQLATLVKEPPASDAWLHEIKVDGYRLGCRIDAGEVTLISRNDRDWTREFPEIRDAAARLPVRSALLDGEVAILRADGRTSFQALQDALAGGPRDGLVYVVFDLLQLDGEALTHAPTEQRKARLEALLKSAPAGPLQYSRHWVGGGPVVYREACRLGLEGIVSKRRDAPYDPGRRPTWVKTKCSLRQEFVVGGFTDAKGSTSRIGALLVGVRDASGRLAFVGKVGTGFTHQLAEALHRRLSAMAVRECPFAGRLARPLARSAHWVRPELLAEVAFAKWTRDGHIRHPSFQGLREDKGAEEVTREQAVDVRPTRNRVPESD